jgi:transcription elongation factor Elf1
LAKSLTRQRAERIARSHACIQCNEYSYKKLTVKPASAEHRAEFGETWHVVAVCGICGVHQELGIDDEGDILYAG